MALPTNDSANQFTSETFLDPYGIFMPQKRRELVYFQSEEYFSLDIFQELKMTEPVEGQTFTYFVEPKKVVNLVAAEDMASGGANNSITFEIDATAGIANGIYARGREILRRASGQQLIVLSVSVANSTITVKAKSGAAVEAVTTGEVFTIVGNASPEASNPRVPLTGVPREVSNQLQIMQEIAQASGSVQTDKTWFEVAQADSNGQLVNKKYWFAWEIAAAWDRLTNQRANTLVASKKETYTDANLTTDFGSQSVGSIYTTGGVIDQYTAEGNNMYYTNGSLDFTWYNQLENTMIKNYGDRENIMFSGIDFTHQNSSWIIDMFKNGAITYGAFSQSASAMAKDPYTGAGDASMVSGKELAIKMGFQSFSTPTGFTWHWKSLAEFNAPDGLGALGFGFNSLVIPTQQFRTSQGKMSKVVRVRYKQLPNGGQVATGFRNSTRNSSAPNSTGDFDSIEMIVNEGVEVLTPWKGLYVQPQN